MGRTLCSLSIVRAPCLSGSEGSGFLDRHLDVRGVEGTAPVSMVTRQALSAETTAAGDMVGETKGGVAMVTLEPKRTGVRAKGFKAVMDGSRVTARKIGHLWRNGEWMEESV